MKSYEYQKKVPLLKVLQSFSVLFRIAWTTDKTTVFFYYFSAFIGGLIPLGTSWILKILIDQLQIIQDENVSLVPMIIVLALVMYYAVGLVQTLFHQTYHFSYLDFVLRNRLQNALNKRFVQKVAELDIAHLEDHKTQDLITQVRTPVKWQVPDIMRLLSYVSTELIIYLSAFIALAPFGWWIPFVVTLITLPKLYLRSKYGALQWSIWGAGAPQVRKLYYYERLFADSVVIREMKVNQSANRLVHKLDTVQDYLFGLNHQVLKKYLRVSILPPIIEAAVIFLIAYSFLGEVAAATVSIGTYTFLISMLGQVNGSAGRAASNFGGLYENGLYLYNFAKMLKIPPAIPRDPNASKVNEVAPPKVEFKNVSFSYPNGPDVLHNISFTIDPGESIALVGHNGAGKSTLINLLCRFYDVSEGEILINGVNIKQIDLSSWYATLGTLFQNYGQYHFTIRENIAAENAKEAPLAKLKEAAQKSGAHAFIDRMPLAYDQQLGKEFEKGEELSGGQWQKLAIARAFYDKPPILIMDEPTSAIDAEAEFEIFNNLEEQYQDKSLILVSHRFSTVRNADKIYVLEHGRIIERGSHEDLMKKEGRYAQLFLTQAKGYQ